MSSAFVAFSSLAEAKNALRASDVLFPVGDNIPFFPLHPSCD